VRLTQCALLDTICHCTPSRRAGRRADTGTSTCADSAREAGLCSELAVSYMRARLRRRVQRLQIDYPLWHIKPCMAQLVHCDALGAHVYLCTPSCQCTVISCPAYKQLRAASLAVLAYTEQTEQNALAGPSHLLHIHCKRALAHRIHLDSRRARGERRSAAAGRRKRRGAAASRPARRTSPPGRRRCRTRWRSCAPPVGPAGR